jgi:hypothetical protein
MGWAATDMQGAALFKMVDQPRIGKAWTCQSDLDEKKRDENYVEFEFEAQPGLEYRCHVYVGGCCQETLAVHWQCTELVKDGVPMDPGKSRYLSKKPSAASAQLPKKHADHLKEPTFWEWRTLDLPPFKSAGPKKIRLLTNQKAFSVAFAVVSTRVYLSNPPRDLEEARKLLNRR